MTDLSVPHLTQKRLEEIERDLAHRQNAYEAAARSWYGAQREIVRRKAHALLTSDASTVAEKRAQGDLDAYDVEGAASEAEFEALRAAVKVLEMRATIGMSILKSQNRI